MEWYIIVALLLTGGVIGACVVAVWFMWDWYRNNPFG